MRRLVSLIVIILFILTSVSANSTISADTLEIPFLEDWSSGSLDTNGWQVEGDGWLISNDVGDPSPSVEFRAELVGGESGYTSVLVSKPLSAKEMLTGDIFLDYNVRLDNKNGTGQEHLFIEISNDGGDNWIQVAQTDNVWDIDFEDGFNHVNITSQSMDTIFYIRFRATGSNPADIESWFLDNIHVYRSCTPPTNLEGEYFYENQNWGAEICWEAPEVPVRYGGCLYWDNEVYAGGVGLTDGGNFSIAQRWDAGQLKNWHGEDWSGLSLGSLLLVLNEDGFDEVIAKIWCGPNADSLLYEQEIVDPEIGEWFSVPFDEPVEFDTDEELWIGYTVINQPAGMFPAGNDEGPAVTGYGDMISTDGGISWVAVSEVGIDNNWVVHACISQDPWPSPPISHFNVYRQEVGVDDEYGLYNTVNFEEGVMSYCYQDFAPNVSGGQTYNYKVTANWYKENDTCESNPSLTIDMFENFVTVLVTDIENQESTEVTLYPNPLTTSTTITYNLQQPSTVQISIFNHLGKQVELIQQTQSQGKQQVSWDASGLPSGVYYFRMQAGEQVASGKMVVVR